MSFTHPKYEDRKRYVKEHIHSRPDTLDGGVIWENVDRGQYLELLNLQKDDIVLDLGAHIGTFSCVVSPFVKKIYAFEPTQENVELLRRNVEQLCDNVIIEQYAIVGNDDTERQFYYIKSFPYHNSGNSLVRLRGRIPHVVQCKNINRVLEETGANKLKVDIEGTEKELFYAIDDFTQIEEIIFEWHFMILHDASHDQYHAALKHLADHGFGYIHVEKELKGQWFYVTHVSRTPRQQDIALQRS